ASFRRASAALHRSSRSFHLASFSLIRSRSRTNSSSTFFLERSFASSVATSPVSVRMSAALGAARAGDEADRAYLSGPLIAEEPKASRPLPPPPRLERPPLRVLLMRGGDAKEDRPPRALDMLKLRLWMLLSDPLRLCVGVRLGALPS